jgi:hypothetical protein
MVNNTSRGGGCFPPRRSAHRTPTLSTSALTQ